MRKFAHIRKQLKINHGKEEAEELESKLPKNLLGWPQYQIYHLEVDLSIHCHFPTK